MMTSQLSCFHGRRLSIWAVAAIAVLAGAAISTERADGAPRVASAGASWSEGVLGLYGIYAKMCDNDRRGKRLVAHITVRHGGATWAQATFSQRRGPRGCVNISRSFQTYESRHGLLPWVTVKVTNPTTKRSSARRVRVRVPAM